MRPQHHPPPHTTLSVSVRPAEQMVRARMTARLNERELVEGRKPYPASTRKRERSDV